MSPGQSVTPLEKTMKLPRSRRHGLGFAAVALSVALLQACGGGSSSSTTNSGAISPTLNGTVTGFGSVVVDGVEVEDAYARVAYEKADGTLSNDALQMGQRVRVAHDGAGKASQVLIDAAVIGQVTAVNTSSNTLTVAGQVVTVNSDSASGPVTVFGGGYTDLSSVAISDLVQVHGTPVYNATSSSYQVQATRIQKDAGQARVQVNGKVTAYATNSTGATFTLNGLTVNTNSSTVLRPSGASLAEGVQVTVYGGSLSGSTLNATHVRVNRDQNSGNTTMQAQLSGVVSNYNATAGSFELQGSTVKVGTATVQPTGATLGNNAYAMVKGSVASDGSITATQIQIRSANVTTDLSKVLLIGTISDYVSDSSFLVRGVPVDATGISPTNCPSNFAFSSYTNAIKVQAVQQSGTAVVKAERIECQSTNTAKLIKPLDGTVSSVDATAKTFSLTVSGSSSSTSTSQTVQWNDVTTFLGLSADTLAGKLVHVDGYTDTNNAFVARVVRLDDDSAEAPKMDDKRFRRPRQGGSESEGWTEYRNRR